MIGYVWLLVPIDPAKSTKQEKQKRLQVKKRLLLLDCVRSKFVVLLMKKQKKKLQKSRQIFSVMVNANIVILSTSLTIRAKPARAFIFIC